MGTINSINSVYEYFKNKKNGHISIVSSVAGYRGLPNAGAYCASKSVCALPKVYIFNLDLIM